MYKELIDIEIRFSCWSCRHRTCSKFDSLKFWLDFATSKQKHPSSSSFTKTRAMNEVINRLRINVRSLSPSTESKTWVPLWINRWQVQTLSHSNCQQSDASTMVFVTRLGLEPFPPTGLQLIETLAIGTFPNTEKQPVRPKLSLASTRQGQSSDLMVMS